MKFFVTVVGATARPDEFDDLDSARKRQAELKISTGVRVLIDARDDEAGPPDTITPLPTLLERVVENVRRRQRQRDGGFYVR